MNGKNILLFASGTATGGGTDFEQLYLSTQNGELDASIVAVVSDHEAGGVWRVAKKNGLRFIAFPKENGCAACNYQKMVKDSEADYVILLGWPYVVQGLDPKKTFNVHPGPLPAFGGKGMYGKEVHEAVLNAFRNGQLFQTCLTMHYVTEDGSPGPTFFRQPVEILSEDTAASLAQRVNERARIWVPRISNLLFRGSFRWNGKDPSTLCEAVLQT